ncbi:UNVERIFIED_CONTAM: hypothetical protein FKN15_052745 [Acipenser sinensis]
MYPALISVSHCLIKAGIPSQGIKQCSSDTSTLPQLDRSSAAEGLDEESERTNMHRGAA